MSTRMNARTCNGSPPIWPLANADLRGRMIRGSSGLALTRWINHSAPAHSIGIRQCNGSNSRGTNNVIDRGTEEQKPMMAKNRHGRRSRSNVIIMIILISAIAVYLVIQRQTEQQQPLRFVVSRLSFVVVGLANKSELRVNCTLCSYSSNAWVAPKVRIKSHLPKWHTLVLFKRSLVMDCDVDCLDLFLFIYCNL